MARTDEIGLARRRIVLSLPPMDDGIVLWRAGSAVGTSRKLSDGGLEVDVWVDGVLTHRERFTRVTGAAEFAITMRERYDSPRDADAQGGVR
jgi:hypothetical protein